METPTARAPLTSMVVADHLVAFDRINGVRSAHALS